MCYPIITYLAVEDILSESILRKILNLFKDKYIVSACYSRYGYGYLKNSIYGFNNAAKGIPFLILTDLDKAECPPVLIEEWLKVPKHHNLLLRVAVREVESWLLAHREAMAKYLNIRRELIPTDVDSIPDPKQFIINLTKKSRNRRLREDIVPSENSTAKIGPDYNGRMIIYVEKYWNIDQAKVNSPSLMRTYNVISNFIPIFRNVN